MRIALWRPSGSSQRTFQDTPGRRAVQGTSAALTKRLTAAAGMRALLGSGRPRRLLAPAIFQRVLHGFPERLDGVGAHEAPAVDEERGRPAHAERPALGDIGVDVLPEPPAVEARGEGLPVESEARGVADDILAGELGLRQEQRVVGLPVAPRLGRAAGRLGGGPGACMELQREVLEDEADLAGELRQDLAQHLLGALAVGSLVVGELHDGDGGRGRAPDEARVHRERAGHQRIRLPRARGGPQRHGHGGEGQDASHCSLSCVRHYSRLPSGCCAATGSGYARPGDEARRRRDPAQGAAMGFLLRVVMNTLAIVLAGSVMPGVEVGCLAPGPGAGLLLGIVNAVIRPVLLVLTLPITLFTLGLFLLVLNGLCFWFVAVVVNGFYVAGFWSAVGGALLVSATSWVATAFVSDRGRIAIITRA